MLYQKLPTLFIFALSLLESAHFVSVFVKNGDLIFQKLMKPSASPLAKMFS